MASPTIDTHCHWMAPEFLAFLQSDRGRAAIAPGGAGRLDEVLSETYLLNFDRMTSLDAILAEMDDAEVDMAVLSAPPPGASFGDVETACQAAREVNDVYLAAAAARPDRFGVLVVLPLPHVEPSIAELNRVADHDRAQGLVLHAVSQGWTLDAQVLEPVYRRAAELGMPVQVHPPVEVLPPAFDDWRLDASLAPMVSTSLTVARMILSGMLDRLPELDIIVPHLGGTMPYLAQRFIDFGQGDAAEGFSHYLRHRFYYDTCSHSPPAYRCFVETVGHDRVMLGSDYPARGTLRRAVDFVAEVAATHEERDAVLGGTAARWFRPTSMADGSRPGRRMPSPAQ